jgi:hypothetical protein
VADMTPSCSPEELFTSRTLAADFSMLGWAAHVEIAIWPPPRQYTNLKSEI